MNEQGIFIEKLPQEDHSILISGFDGWGNALDVSRATATYLIRKLNAEYFARINPEPFYRYDENRPQVEVDQGCLKGLSPPGGAFYAARAGLDKKGVVILKASEPNLRWLQFADEVLSLCHKLKTRTIINVGSMYDDVLHSDLIISGFASDEELVSMLKQKEILPITYSGPGGIHSTLHSEAQKRGFRCISLWGHCPYYLQGATHFGLVSRLGSILSSLGELDLDVEELDLNWKVMGGQIKTLIDKNPELKAMVNGLRKARGRGTWVNRKDPEKKTGKIIQIRDFLEPK